MVLPVCAAGGEHACGTGILARGFADCGEALRTGFSLCGVGAGTVGCHRGTVKQVFFRCGRPLRPHRGAGRNHPLGFDSSAIVSRRARPGDEVEVTPATLYRRVLRERMQAEKTAETLAQRRAGEKSAWALAELHAGQRQTMRTAQRREDLRL